MKKFPELENLIKIFKILDELNIAYYVTGGFAVSVFGHPRFTADVDIVIKMQETDAKVFSLKIKNVFPQGYIDIDLIKHALIHKSEFNMIDPESGLKIDFFITKLDEFEKSAFNRIIKKDIDYEVAFISPEDLIISKLLWFREGQSTRQLEDIITVIQVQKNLDKQYLAKWVSNLKLSDEWQKLQILLDKLA